MIKGSTARQADYPIQDQFLDRWSPRSMSGADISLAELMTLFEAARWAPSSFNAQPWRMLFARRNTPDWPTFLGLLTERNQAWARSAAALIVFVSKKINDRTGTPSVTHSYDTGAAWGYFALQGFLKGYAVHGMGGFDHAGAREALEIPEAFHVEAMAAVGRPAPKEALLPQLQEHEAPSDRRPLRQTVCEGRWRLP